MESAQLATDIWTNRNTSVVDNNKANLCYMTAKWLDDDETEQPDKFMHDSNTQAMSPVRSLSARVYYSKK